MNNSTHTKYATRYIYVRDTRKLAPNNLEEFISKTQLGCMIYDAVTIDSPKDIINKHLGNADRLIRVQDYCHFIPTDYVLHLQKY